MREKLNSNPLVQMAVIAVLLVGVAVFLLGSMGGGEEEAAEPSAPSSSEVAPSPTAEGAAPEGATPAGLSSALAMVNQATAGTARPLPRPVMEAWRTNKAVVLLFVHDGGIDDALVRAASDRLAALPAAATFVIPASKISRYAAVTEGVGLDRVPALVVIRPKKLDQTVPTASVSYGFQSGASVVQAVIDAGYKGPTLEYHP
jgi:hypothetical protein